MELTIYKAEELIHAVPILKFAKLCNGLYAIQIDYEEALFIFMNEGEIRYSEEVDNIYDHIDEECDKEEIYSWTEILYRRTAWDTVKIVISPNESVELKNQVNK